MLSVLAARDDIADTGDERWEKGGIRRPRDKELKGLKIASTLTYLLLLLLPLISTGSMMCVIALLR